VQRVSKAFISGSFSSDGITFGANKYGDLKAVAAAISLDPESLSHVVDDDPTSGNIREPLLKVMQILRSLTFQRRSNVKFRHGLLENMSYKIGQFVFDPPDQFSFFAHDYAPPGVFAETGLVSPESELLSMSSVVGIMNGFISLVDYGLANHDGGFGPYITKPPEFIGDYTTSVGHLRYRPSNNTNSVSNMVEELSTLMTAGRLSAENKQVMLDAHAYFNTNNGTASADRVLVKLFAATPEFHTSNTGNTLLPTLCNYCTTISLLTNCCSFVIL
jgi:cullin-associated NEDD8-dissociated protein 1